MSDSVKLTVTSAGNIVFDDYTSILYLFRGLVPDDTWLVSYANQESDDRDIVITHGVHSLRLAWYDNDQTDGDASTVASFLAGRINELASFVSSLHDSSAVVTIPSALI